MPMQQMSSEEALNKIHDMIGSMMNMYAQEDKNKSEGKSEDNVSKLIKGLIDNADNDAAAAAGQQLESLAKGMQELSKIDTSTINDISASINTINNVLGKLNVSDNTSADINAFIKAIEKLGSIDENASENLKKFLQNMNIQNADTIEKSMQAMLSSVQGLQILSTIDFGKINNNLKNIDPNIADNVSKFISILSSNIKPNANSEQYGKTILNVIQTLGVLSSIDTKKLNDNLKKLDPAIAQNLIQFINTIIDGLNKESIQLNQKSSKAILNMAQVLQTISLIDVNKLNKTLKKLDPKLARKISDFIDELSQGLSEIENSEDVEKLIAPIGSLFAGLNAIISTNVFKLRLGLNPLKGRLLGKRIGKFIGAIVEGIPEKKINENIKYIGDLLTPLVALADPNKEFSIHKLKKVFSVKNAQRIGQFFQELVKVLNEQDKETLKSVSNITDLLNCLQKFSLFMTLHFALAAKMLNLEAATKFNTFLHTLVSGDWDEDKVKSMKKFIMSLVLTFAAAFAVLTATIAAAPGSAIIAFGVLYMSMNILKNTVKDLINGKNGLKDAETKEATQILNALSKSAAIMGGIIAGITIIGTLFGMDNVLISVGIIKLTMMSIVSTIKQLNEKKVKKGVIDALKTLGTLKEFLIGISASIVILTALSRFSKITDILIAIGALTLTTAAMVGLVIWMTKTVDKRSMKAANDIIEDLTKLILAASVALSILAIASKFVTAGDMTAAVISITLTIGAMVGLVIWMTKAVSEKDMTQANAMLQRLTYTVLGITASIAAMTLLFKFEQDNVTKALATVAGIVIGMVGLVWLLASKADNKKLKDANDVLKTLTGMFAVVAAVTYFLLIPIGKKFGHALKGVATAVLIITALVGLTWLLASKANDKQLEQANKTMLTLSGVLAITALVTEFLLIPIGKHLGDALKGAGAAVAVVGALALLTWLLASTANDKQLEQANKTMLVLSGVLAIVSLTMKFLLIPIGADATNALQGAGVALGVVLGLVGLTYLLTKIEEKKLQESYKTLGILTAELLIVSLTIRFILKPVGEQAKEALFGTSIAAGVIVGMISLVKWIMTFEEKKLYESYKALGILTAELLIISLTIKFILVPIGEKAKEALFGSVIAMGIVVGMVALVKWIMTFDEKKLHESYKALGILTAELLVISLTIKFILSPIGENAKEALFGSAIAMGVVVGMIALVKWIMTFDEKKLHESYKALGILTAELLVISLTIKYILSPIGEKAKEAFLGSAIAMGVILGLVGIVRLLMSFDEKEMKTSYIALGILTAELLIIGLVLKNLVIPVGIQAKETLFGVAIILATVMGLIGITWLLGKIEDKDLKNSLIALGVLTIILTLVSLTAKYLLIPIGEQAEDALKGGAIAIGLVVIMTGIIYVLGKLMQKGGKELQMGMVKGGVVLLASIGLLYLLGEGIKPLVEVSKMVGEDPKTIAIGGGIILGAVAIIALAMIGIGKLVSDPIAALATAAGAAVLWAAIELLGLLGETVLTFTTVIDKVKKYDMDTLKNAGLGITVVLGIIAETSVGILAVAGPSAAAGLVASPIYGVTVVLFNILELVSDEILHLNEKITPAEIKKFNQIVYDPKDKKNPNTLIGSFHNMVDGFNSLSGFGSVVAAIVSQVIKPIIDTVSKYVDVVLKVATGHYIIGYDDNGNPIYERIPDGAFLSAALAVNKGFSDFLTELNKGFKALGTEVKLFGWLYAKTLDPIVKLVGKFVDVVLKVATSTYIIGYDDNGKPEYKHLTAQEFGAAGKAVAEQFSYFLKKLNEGFKSLEADSILAMKMMEWVLFPIITHVGRFVDIVLKVATANYVTGYDENGKPEYTHLTAQEFSNAGTAVSTQFALFIMSLGVAFDNLSESAIDAMKCVKKTMGPIMDTLSKFVDAVIKVATGTYISGYDKDGKAEYTHIEVDDFIDAGKAVSSTFKEFIISLNDSFSLLSEDTQDAIKNVGKALKPIMEGVQNYIDAVLRFATGQYVSGFDKDKNGNYTVPIFTKLTNEELLDAGRKVGEMFGYFVTSITDSFDKGGNMWGSKTEDAMEAIADSIGPVMESLGTFVDAIMKVATGTYMDGYVKDSKGNYLKDKDGKLIADYKHLTKEDFKHAAEQVAELFVSFMNKLIEKFSDEQFKEKAENLQDIINSSIKPIMEAVKSFSDALKPFLNIKQQKTDDKGNKTEDYLAFKPGAIKQVADDIANGFVSFIDIIYREVFSEEKQKNFKEIKKNAKNVEEVLEIVKKSAGHLAKIIKAFTSDNAEDNITQKSVEAANGFNDVMTIIVDYYADTTHNFEGAVAPATSCLTLMKVIGDIASKFKEIMNRVSSVNSKDINMTDLTNMLNKNILNLAINILNVNNAIQGIEFSKIYEMISAYAMLSLKYVELSRLLNEEPTLQSGFTGLTNNIQRLADENLRHNISATTISLGKYTLSIGKFTTSIEKSTKSVEVYTTTLEKARKTLAALDKQIIDKAKDREKALQNLADKINNIAYAVDNLRNAFDALDENAIIDRFDGLRELLELAGIIDKSEQGKKASENKSESQSRAQAAATNRPQNSRQGNNNTYNYGFGGARSGHVTFQFANTVLDGTFRST